MISFPSSALPIHKTFVQHCIDTLSTDPRIVGIALSGSYSDNSLDEYSDLDFVIAINPADIESVMSERKTLIAQIAPLLAAFTGEHVGEPRAMICLYQLERLLHVDFKFVALADAVQRVDEPTVVWQRDNCLSDVLSVGEGHYPAPDLQWLEDRMWVWTHYAADKIKRGEYFETIEFLSFLRQQVLGPLAMVANGLEAKGVRKIEQVLPEFSLQLRATLAAPEPTELKAATQAAVMLYLILREQLIASGNKIVVNSQAQTVCVDYLQHI